jgi:hypothetical protein
MNGYLSNDLSYHPWHVWGSDQGVCILIWGLKFNVYSPLPSLFFPKKKSFLLVLKEVHFCRNPSFGLATKAKGVARVQA